MKKTDCLKLSSLLAAFLLTSCGTQAALPSDPQTKTDAVVSDDSTSNKGDSVEDDSSNEMGGGAEPCSEHSLTYHSVPGVLVDAVGQADVHQWYELISTDMDHYGRINENFSIQAFIEKYDVSKADFISISREFVTDSFLENFDKTREEYYEEFGYTDAQIDALYSGDQEAINRAFCGPLAFVNEADGELYSIYWLNEHSPEEYVEKELPMEEVQGVIDRANGAGESDYLVDPALIEAVESNFMSAMSLSEAVE